MNCRFCQLLYIAVFVTLAFTQSGCDKFRDNRQTTATVENAAAEATFNDFFRVVDQVLSGTAALASDPCITYTSSPAGANYPKTYTITFTDGCEDFYNITRSGSITATLSGPYGANGETVIISATDVKVNDYTATGSLKLTSTGTAADKVFKFVVTDAAVTGPDDEAFTWSCNRVYTLVEKHSVELSFDDVYEITGEASGLSSEERTFSVELTVSGRKEQNCRWLRSGTAKITVEELTDREVVFGVDPECDEEAVCCDNYVVVNRGNKEIIVNLE